ncbi:XRE family transcriptional regulator [uncultured Pontibacter sp.]|uniref:helix-turn-helix domain-containing protein n=1 Tax=uncultured Pontibacter sp. TaxID=453356 RepID=UPI00262501AC|nr:XRE family transcriptional regulator [uncultured Pontibacter sp.]
MHIGKRIKEIVEKSRITNKELADRVGTSENNIYKIYNKEHISTDVLLKISNALNIEIHSFFDSEGSDHKSGVVQQSVSGGSRNVQVVGTYQDCMNELIAAHQVIIAEKEKNSRLQQEIIEMLKERKK